MVSVLISVIQHEQYYLIILLIGIKVETLIRKRLWHRCFSKMFAKFLGKFFFIEHIWVVAFGLGFVNPRKKSERTSLVKFLQSCHFNIK